MQSVIPWKSHSSETLKQQMLGHAVILRLYTTSFGDIFSVSDKAINSKQEEMQLGEECPNIDMFKCNNIFVCSWLSISAGLLTAHIRVIHCPDCNGRDH